MTAVELDVFDLVACRTQHIAKAAYGIDLRIDLQNVVAMPHIHRRLLAANIEMKLDGQGGF